ncbi:MAG: hypothetical protein R3C03_17170 [Pirellulaceae bacterium]
MLTCPSTDELLAVLAESSGDSRTLSHIESCIICQRELERLNTAFMQAANRNASLHRPSLLNSSEQFMGLLQASRASAHVEMIDPKAAVGTTRRKRQWLVALAAMAILALAISQLTPPTNRREIVGDLPARVVPTAKPRLRLVSSIRPESLVDHIRVETVAPAGIICFCLASKRFRSDRDCD